MKSKATKRGSKNKPSKKTGFEALRELRDALVEKNATAPARGSQASPAPRPAPPKSSQDKSHQDSSSQDKGGQGDAQLLSRAYVGVVPLDRPPGRLPRQPLEPRSTTLDDARGPRDGEEVHERLRVLALGDSTFEVSDDGDHVEGRRADVPRDLLRRLRHGRLPVDARLDLHGMRAKEARESVQSFLRAMRQRRERVVLVIHGKGEHSPLGMGVLRGEIAAWLSQGSASEYVAAFATARESDGGPGALYVLLRR